MLERIEVKGYQSLKDIDLRLGSFTVIVGPSGNGKSSLIRALKAICFNQAGHRFISHNQQRAWVRLTLDGGQTVEWEKPKDKSATYTTDDQLYTRTGRAVPEDIEKLIGIRKSTSIKVCRSHPNSTHRMMGRCFSMNPRRSPPAPWLSSPSCPCWSRRRWIAAAT